MYWRYEQAAVRQIKVMEILKLSSVKQYHVKYMGPMTLFARGPRSQSISPWKVEMKTEGHLSAS